jgi:DNA-binding transcriptional LysR family regulator
VFDAIRSARPHSELHHGARKLWRSPGASGHRARAQPGVSQSALSHTIRSLEARHGLRLLTRTTRSVSATETGERVFEALSPRFEQIDAELAAPCR